LKTYQKTSAAFTAAVLLLGATAANAANITINDNNTGSNGYVEDNGSSNSGWYKGGPTYAGTGAQSEYQEVEPGMQLGAVWDLAAFVTPGSGRLGIVSGYNLGAGYGNTKIGDIMVSLNPGSLNGFADPGTVYPHYVANSAYGYDFAVKFNFTTSTYTVLQINSQTLMENGEYNSDQYGGYDYNAASQPWRVANAFSGNYDAAHGYNLGTVVATGSLYYSNTASVAAMTSLTGYAVTNEYKYYAEIGTSWLAPFLPANNPSVLYKLTMECGNDNMLGTQSSGFTQVPDASATIAMLGLGFLGLAGVAKFKGRKIG